jgi:hypothetical protein
MMNNSIKYKILIIFNIIKIVKIVQYLKNLFINKISLNMSYKID